MRVVEEAKKSGAQGAILGCTEIPILLKGVDCGVKLYDTMRLHTEALVDYAIKESPAP